MGATKDADHSADTIEFLQKRMLEFAERFRLLAESWRGDQFGVLKVTRDPQRVRGIENLKNFASAVEKALDDERERIGKTRVVKTAEESPPKKKKVKE